jgi:hypothetical protein
MAGIPFRLAAGLLRGDFFAGLRLVVDDGAGLIELMESTRADHPA